MQLNKVLSLDCTKAAVQCSSKKRAFEIISELAANHANLDIASDLFQSMLGREKVGATCIGQGVAIPHGRIAGIEQAIAVLILCEEPIDFHAIDNRPVDILFALFVPDEQCESCMQTLSEVAARFKDKQVLKRLRRAQSDEELYNIAIFEQTELSHIAMSDVSSVSIQPKAS